MDHRKRDLVVENTLVASLGSTLPWPLPMTASLCYLCNMVFFPQLYLGSIAVVLQTIIVVLMVRC